MKLCCLVFLEAIRIREEEAMPRGRKKGDKLSEDRKPKTQLGSTVLHRMDVKKGGKVIGEIVIRTDSDQIIVEGPLAGNVGYFTSMGMALEYAIVRASRTEAESLEDYLVQLKKRTEELKDLIKRSGLNL